MLKSVPSDGATAIAVLYSSNMVLGQAYTTELSSVGLVGRIHTEKTMGDRDSVSRETERENVDM